VVSRVMTSATATFFECLAISKQMQVSTTNKKDGWMDDRGKTLCPSQLATYMLPEPGDRGQSHSIPRLDPRDSPIPLFEQPPPLTQRPHLLSSSKVLLITYTDSSFNLSL